MYAVIWLGIFCRLVLRLMTLCSLLVFKSVSFLRALYLPYTPSVATLIANDFRVREKDFNPHFSNN